MNSIIDRYNQIKKRCVDFLTKFTEDPEIAYNTFDDLKDEYESAAENLKNDPTNYEKKITYRENAALYRDMAERYTVSRRFIFTRAKRNTIINQSRLMSDVIHNKNLN